MAYYDNSDIVDDLEVKFTYKGRKFTYRFGEQLKEAQKNQYIELNNDTSTIMFTKKALQDFLLLTLEGLE